MAVCIRPQISRTATVRARAPGVRLHLLAAPHDVRVANHAGGMAMVLTPNDQMHLEMAAKGCVSGTLREWPLLRRAFVAAGVVPDENWTTAKMREMAQGVLREAGDDGQRN
jgi:hypothetical protein